MLMTKLAGVREIMGYAVRDAAGEIGKVNEVYFDERNWTIHHLCVETPEQSKIILPVSCIEGTEWDKRFFFVDWEKKEPEEKPLPLRGAKEIIGRSIGASDGVVGYVDDLIFNDADWAVRYLAIEIGGWLNCQKVLVSPWWVEDIQWDRSQFRLGITREEILESPEYQFHAAVDRNYEDQLFEQAHKPKYWV